MKPDKVILETLSEYVVSLQLTEIPNEVQHQAKMCLIDVCGVILAGAKTPSAKMLSDIACITYGAGNSDVIGTDYKLNPAGAAFANGSSAHALDFDDNCYAGIVHGSAVVFPGVLAMAQELNASGKDLLLGFIVGLEVELAVAKALSNSIYDRGWWTTSILGAIGSAAGASKIAGLSSKLAANALSLAIVGGGATRAVRGTTAKHYYCGRAAESGVTASLAANRGATGPANVFQDSSGIAKVLNDDIFDATIIERLKTEFSLLNPGPDLKKYPVCYASHSCIDAVKEIVKNNLVNCGDVLSLTCLVPPIVASNLTYSMPKTVTQAQFSLQFAIAVVLFYGDVKLEHLDHEVVCKPEVKRLFERIKMTVGEIPKQFAATKSICPEWGYVELTTRKGVRRHCFIGSPLGSALRPMPKDILRQKFDNCCSYGGCGESADLLYDKISNIENISKVRELFQ